MLVLVAVALVKGGFIEDLADPTRFLSVDIREKSKRNALAKRQEEESCKQVLVCQPQGFNCTSCMCLAIFILSLKKQIKFDG